MLIIIVFVLLSSMIHVEAKSLYLDLMKKCLINSIYQDKSTYWPGHALVQAGYQQADREVGLDWPSVAHTMIGRKRLDNVQFCLEDVLKNNIPGDVIETGVWRGGATIFMRAILKEHGNTNKKVWVADSFEGLPAPKPELYPADAPSQLHTYKELVVSLEEVQANFERYGLLDNQVKFLKGWFCDTLPTAPIKKLSLMRLDGDLYESTMDALVNLYPKLSVGGYVIIDDYGAIEFCAQAVHDFRKKYGITDKLQKVDHSAVYWKRTK